MDKKDITTQTLVAKTKTVTGKSVRFDVEQCLDFLSKKISNSKTETSILQIRTGFKNAFICDMYLDEPSPKTISLKICKNGSFQFTGCITVTHAYNAIKYILNIVRELYKQPPCNIIIYEVMSNYRVDLNRTIKQCQLLKFFKKGQETFDDPKSIIPKITDESTSLYPIPTESFDPSFKCFRSTSCAALNCKYLLDTNEVLQRPVYQYDENGFICQKPYVECISQKELQREQMKDYYITFLIFESGKVIISGINESIINRIYSNFIKYLNIYFTNHALTEEKSERRIVSKRQSYDKLVLLLAETSSFANQYILIRGKNVYISSRKNRLLSKYQDSKIVYEETCNNVDAFKMLKHMIKTEAGITFNNVIITVSSSSSEERLLKLLKECNVQQ